MFYQCRQQGRYPWLSGKAGLPESGPPPHHVSAGPFPNGCGILLGAAWPIERSQCGRDLYNPSIWIGLLRGGLCSPYSHGEASLHSDGTEKRCLCGHERGTF